MSKAMITLAGDSELRVRMGQAGQKVVKEGYSLEAQGDRLARVYEEVLSTKKSNSSDLTAKM